MKFDELYNLIMQDREQQFLPRLNKYKAKNPSFNVQQTLNDLLTLPSKESKLACTLIVNDLITGIKDEKFNLYKKDILTKNIDVGDIKQILNATSQKGTKISNNSLRDLYDRLQTKFDCLYDKQLLDNKVVIYTIKETRKAMIQIRQIVDAFQTKERSVWCLIRRQNDGNMDQGWSNWMKYNAYPKQIAFQDKQLLAFNANQSDNILWWDKADLTYSPGILKDLYGRYVRGIKDPPMYSRQQRRELTLKQLQELQQDSDGKYKTRGDLNITDNILINGHLPFKYLTVGGDMDCSYCQDLTSFEGFPTMIGQNLILDGCKNLTSLVGAPDKVGGYIYDAEVFGIPFKEMKLWKQNAKLEGKQ